MGKKTLSNDNYTAVYDNVTQGGKQSPTGAAEERMRSGLGLDPLVDPKGPAHLGPIRRSLPRLEMIAGKDNPLRGLWLMTCGPSIAIERLLDTTGSMGNNVSLAFDSLPHSFDMLKAGKKPVLGRYDPQMASSIFNDLEDRYPDKIPVLARTQFEMDEKIALQMAMLTPGYGGKANGKEDPQFGLFAAAYLTAAANFLRYGIRSYHFTTSDEPTAERIEFPWLEKVFGEEILKYLKENGFSFTAQTLPDTGRMVTDLQQQAHAFFLQVGNRSDVTEQWTEFYGTDHVVKLPNTGTLYLHCVEAVIIGLTEGTLSLGRAAGYLKLHGVPEEDARSIVRAVAHIPVGAQMLCPNFNKLPKVGDVFRNKTDTWPLTQDELDKLTEKSGVDVDASADRPAVGPEWVL